MKHIVKGQEPREFTDWKNCANGDWQPTYGDLCGDEKKAVKTALMLEQGYICCYCERELEGHDSHIEHFNPQSTHVSDSLNFSNMLCSCQGQQKCEPRHCGNLKGNEVLPISPLESDCESKFTYTADGYIGHVSNDRDAEDTIRILGLGIDKLNALRKGAIEGVFDDINDINEESLAIFVNEYLTKIDGKYKPFHTTIGYLTSLYLSEPPDLSGS